MSTSLRWTLGPHKFKGGVSGCVRECAEAQSKVFGLIATDRGWSSKAVPFRERNGHIGLRLGAKSGVTLAIQITKKGSSTLGKHRIRLLVELTPRISDDTVKVPTVARQIQPRYNISMTSVRISLAKLIDRSIPGMTISCSAATRLNSPLGCC